MAKAIDKFFRFINPIAHLGERKYPTFLPVIVIILVTLCLEFYAYVIARNPDAVGLMAIAVYVFLIIYFAFRSGIRGGFIAVILTLTYYAYIISSRNYTGGQFTASVNTSIALGFLYFLLAFLVGWLKQKIDKLIDDQVIEKKRLQTIIKQLPVAVVVADNKGQVVLTNNQAKLLFGEKFKKGVRVGRSSEHLRHPQTGKFILEEEYPMHKAFSKKIAVKNKEFMVKKPNDNTSYVLGSSAPVFNKKEEVVAGVSIFQDITILKELQKRKDDFVNMASHELKTPITSMVLFMDVLKRRLARGDFEKSMQTYKDIEKQTQSLRDLINTLLDVSRIQTGKILFRKERFKLNQIVKDAVSALQENSDQNIKIVNNPKIEVYADKLRVYQVLINFIANAIKYTKGKGDILVKVSKKPGRVEVFVRDFGIGIKKSEQPRIFDKLYQVSEDKAATFPGFGMGLYISKEIIKRHKGKIWVDSKLGEGATFYFSLPL